MVLKYGPFLPRSSQEGGSHLPQLPPEGLTPWVGRQLISERLPALTAPLQLQPTAVPFRIRGSLLQRVRGARRGGGRAECAWRRKEPPGGAASARPGPPAPPPIGPGLLYLDAHPVRGHRRPRRRPPARPGPEVTAARPPSALRAPFAQAAPSWNAEIAARLRRTARPARPPRLCMGPATRPLRRPRRARLAAQPAAQPRSWELWPQPGRPR